jgi:hypothetical protein
MEGRPVSQIQSDWLGLSARGSSGCAVSILLTAAFGKPHEMASDDRPSATRRHGAGSPTPDPVTWLTPDAADHDRNLVAAYVTSLVRKGRAGLRMLGNGDVELRLKNGQIFHLGDEGLTRVA